MGATQTAYSHTHTLHIVYTCPKYTFNDRNLNNNSTACVCMCMCTSS